MIHMIHVSTFFAFQFAEDDIGLCSLRGGRFCSSGDGRQASLVCAVRRPDADWLLTSKGCGSRELPYYLD